MSLRRKLILLFSLTSLIPILLFAYLSITISSQTLRESMGTQFRYIAEEKANTISKIIDGLTYETKLIAEYTFLKQSVELANASYMGREDAEVEAEIDEIDREWIQSHGKSVRADEVLHSSFSRFLEQLAEREESKYGEIFVTDIRGAAIGMTKPLTDYYQGDEGWWKMAFHNGKGRGVSLGVR